jgi:hypothetical protein
MHSASPITKQVGRFFHIYYSQSIMSLGWENVSYSHVVEAAKGRISSCLLKA